MEQRGKVAIFFVRSRGSLSSAGMRVLFWGSIQLCICVAAVILTRSRISRREKSHVGWALVPAVGLFVIAGCSVNEFGFVRHERFETKGAYVHSSIAYGLHIDTRDDDPSLSLGRYEALYVFPTRCRGAANFGRLSDKDLFRSIRPQLSYSLMDGFQLKAGRGEVSVTMGVREHLVALSVDRSASVARTIYFDPERPHATILRIERESDCRSNQVSP